MHYSVGNPDPTPEGDHEVCESVDPVSDQYLCTWPKGHDGQHVAGNSYSVTAVWYDLDPVKVILNDATIVHADRLKLINDYATDYRNEEMSEADYDSACFDVWQESHDALTELLTALRKEA